MSLGRRTSILALRLVEGALALAAIVAWSIAVIGRVVSDSVPSLQKLAWIPVPVIAMAMLLAILGLAGARRLRRRVMEQGRGADAGKAPRVDLAGERPAAHGASGGDVIPRPKAFGGVATVASVLLALLLADHLLLRWGLPRSCRGSIRLVHWNAASPSERESPIASAALAALDAEILVVSNDWWLFGRPFTREWKDQDRAVHRAGPFALVTDVPMLEARLVLASQGRWAGLFRLEASWAPRGELSILAVDLPSSTELSRRDLAAALRADLASLDLPPIDLVVGDFNMDAASASLAGAFPDHRSAFDRVGQGYAASYPRRFPLWHPDQILVGESIDPCGYRLIDLGVGTHRAQELRLSPADASR